MLQSFKKFSLYWYGSQVYANQLQIEANELQAGHQCEKEREVVVTADQCVPTREEFFLKTKICETRSQKTFQFQYNWLATFHFL